MSRYIAAGAGQTTVTPDDANLPGEARKWRKRGARGRQRGRGPAEQAADREFGRAVAAQNRDAGVSIVDRAEGMSRGRGSRGRPGGSGTADPAIQAKRRAVPPLWRTGGKRRHA